MGAVDEDEVCEVCSDCEELVDEVGVEELVGAVDEDVLGGAKTLPSWRA